MSSPLSPPLSPLLSSPLLHLSVRYSTEVDVDFVRKAVRAIGRCAIKVESAAERCVATLVELIQTKVTYVVQEAVIVIKVALPVLCVCSNVHVLYRKTRKLCGSFVVHFKGYHTPFLVRAEFICAN